MPAPRHRVRDAHTSCLYVCVYMQRERVCVCACDCRVYGAQTSCLCVYIYVERESVYVCLRLDIGYAVLIRLACVCMQSGCVYVFS